ncbi:DUF6531 domain-containing protein [Streptomyces antimycoticus]|uniref:DUF6531 domain-containing protein n=1 Tax=Streptomyces antimycoticus TaxID=68175 RepID=UPI0037D79D24
MTDHPGQSTSPDSPPPPPPPSDNPDARGWRDDVAAQFDSPQEAETEALLAADVSTNLPEVADFRQFDQQQDEAPSATGVENQDEVPGCQSTEDEQWTALDETGTTNTPESRKDQSKGVNDGTTGLPSVPVTDAGDDGELSQGPSLQEALSSTTSPVETSNAHGNIGVSEPTDLEYSAPHSVAAEQRTWNDTGSDVTQQNPESDSGNVNDKPSDVPPHEVANEALSEKIPEQPRSEGPAPLTLPDNPATGGRNPEALKPSDTEDTLIDGNSVPAESTAIENIATLREEASERSPSPPPQQQAPTLQRENSNAPVPAQPTKSTDLKEPLTDIPEPVQGEHLRNAKVPEREPVTSEDISKLADGSLEGSDQAQGGDEALVIPQPERAVDPSKTIAVEQQEGVPGSDKTPDLSENAYAHTRQDVGKTTKGTDPIDLATGKMFLPQTDVSLPGMLPLVFTRRVESGYTAGRWFGPSWSSTADQRLEIDSEGIVFVSEDGLLLTYPHPDPDVPALPKAGPRWPLERDARGDYNLTDPATGHTLYFIGPQDVAPGGEGIVPLAQILDRSGHWITFAYNAEGTPTGIAHSAGYELKLTTADGRITALHLAGAAEDGGDQELIRYGYTDGNLTEVINSSGLPLCFAYDDNHRVISWTDTHSRRYHYVYDHQNRCVAEGGEAGHISVRISYDDIDQATGHRLTTVTTPEGHTTRYLVNNACQVVAETNPLGHTTHTTYDRYDRVLSRTDPLGRTTAFVYDEAGHLTQATAPDGSESTVSYNELGLPTALTGPDGTTWTHTYDEVGNCTSTTDPAGHTTQYTYDMYGHPSAITNTLGETSRVRCDQAGLPVEITDPLGAVTRCQRDAFGRPVTITDAVGATTHLAWTVEGKLTHRTYPDGSAETWSYDGEGNCTTHTDAIGGTTFYEHTHFDLLAARTGPDGVRYVFEHDPALRLTKVTNPQGLTWSYTYDQAGRLTAETDFDDHTVRYEYDAAGRLVSRTNPLGQTVTYEHDTRGQIIRKTAGRHTTAFTYDPAGRLTTATGHDTKVVYQRDRLGRIKTETVNGRVLTHTYDPLGRRTKRTTPNGATTTYAYDAADNRTTLTVGSHTLASRHDAVGRETARHIGDALTVTNTWDLLGRLTAQSWDGPSGAPVQRRSYTYRPDGDVTAVDDHLSGRRTFGLDAAGRVTAVHATGWTETYAYDEAGNQTQATWPAAISAADAMDSRTYAGTCITRAGALRYEHDDAGRLTLRQKTRLSHKPDTWRYTWDTEDHLVSVTTPDGTVWSYLYDPFGRRTTKQRLATDGKTVLEQTDFTWDGPTLIEQTTTTPELPHPITLTWDHDGLRPIAQTERITDATTQHEIDTRFFAIITDLVGTPIELVDESGTIAWHTRSTLWGTTTWATDSTAYTPLRFPGQYFDPETGLHYNLHRYYDPTTGQYITTDPLGLGPGPNPRTYVTNPHREIDPLGLMPCGPNENAGYDDTPYAQAGPVPNRGGEAIVHLDFRNLDEKHALITVRSDAGDVMSTHQFGSVKNPEAGVETFKVEELNPKTTLNVKIRLPNADGALAYVEVQMLKTERGEYPAYSLRSQSCVTYCAKVLEAGGVKGVPMNPKKAQIWLREQHG